MLRTRLLSRRAAKGLLCTTQRRGFFDYVKLANGVDRGESVEAQVLAETKAASAQMAETAFSWDFVKWFEEHSPQGAEHYNRLKSQYQKMESFVNDHSLERSAQSVDFSKYRAQIADPTFVDESEVAYYVSRDSSASLKSMDALAQWNTEALDEFESEVQESGDQLLKPLSETEKAELSQKYEVAQKQNELSAAIKSDLLEMFEEFDAERILLGQESLQMQLAQHPMFAEMTEDLTSSKQVFNDYVLFNQHVDYFKKEKMKGIRDENRRKLFLERYEHAAKVVNGCENVPSPAGH